MITSQVNRRKFTVAVCLLGLTFLVGCGGNNTVSGNVTYDGQPIQNGTITFSPVDGQGPSAGAAIQGGQYEVTEITPGDKIVAVKAFDQLAVVTSTEDLARAAEQGNNTAPSKPKKLVPDNAQGNNQTVTIENGSQTHDFKLMPPAKP